MLDFANILYHYTMIPLYDTIEGEDITNIIKHSGIETLVCYQNSLEKILKTSDLAQLKTLIVLDAISNE